MQRSRASPVTDPGACAGAYPEAYSGAYPEAYSEAYSGAYPEAYDDALPMHRLRHSLAAEARSVSTRRSRWRYSSSPSRLRSRLFTGR